MATMLIYLLALLGSSGKPIDAIKVDAIERNVCSDDDLNDCFCQLILWEYLPYLGQFGVVAWTMEKDAKAPVIKRGEHYWVELEAAGKQYTIRADSYRETRTHSSQDPERKNRLIWPETMRRGWK